MIQGLNEELRLDGGAAKEADAIVSECVATVPPFLFEAAKRRRQACHPFSRDSCDICCSKQASTAIDVTLMRDGKTMDVAVPLAGKSG